MALNRNNSPTSSTNLGILAATIRSSPTVSPVVVSNALVQTQDAINLLENRLRSLTQPYVNSISSPGAIRIHGSAIQTSTITAEIIDTINASQIVGLIQAVQIENLNANQIIGAIISTQISSVAADTITGSITAGQITSLTAGQITGVIVTAQLADSILSSARLMADAFKQPERVASLPALPNVNYPVNSLVLLASDKKIYKNTAGVWGVVNASDTITGYLTSTDIASVAATSITGLIVAGQIGSVNSSAITGAITAGQITSITAGQITGLITGSQIALVTITAANIANATITATQIANNTITATQIANATITTTQISGTAGITGGQIANATITATNIANATITSTQISGTAGITGSQIANATITTTQISGTAGITGGQIASATITAANIANATITATQIANATITGTQIANTTIAAANIANLTITAGQIANLTLTGGKLAIGTITADRLVIGRFDNLVENPGLETDLDVSWNKSGIAVIRHSAGLGGDATVPHTGSYCLKISRTLGGSTEYAVSTKSFEAVAGEKFLISFWGKGFGFPDGNWFVAISWIGQGWSDWCALPNGTTDWTYFSVTTTAPAGVTTGVVYIYESGATQGVCYFDDLYVRRMVGTVVIEDASITTAKIGALQVTAAQIANATITATQIANATITNALLVDATIEAAKIKDATITGAKIALATIENANIKDATIESAKIVSIDASKVSTGTLTVKSQITSGDYKVTIDAGLNVFTIENTLTHYYTSFNPGALYFANHDTTPTQTASLGPDTFALHRNGSQKVVIYTGGGAGADGGYIVLYNSAGQSVTLGPDSFGLFGVNSVQRSHIANPDGTLADATTKISSILAALEAYGLLKSS